MKTTRRGLFGLMVGIAGTLALGKGAATEEPPEQVWGIVEEPLPEHDGMYIVYDTYAWGEYRDDWAVEVRADVAATSRDQSDRGIFAKEALIFIEPMKGA